MVDLSYLQRNVFPGESGGDYNALFGYSQRPGGQFAGVNLTDMTVDQALQFAAPSGPYGQWVKGQVGRVATPMGAYQVVGTTLRAAKEGLGLTGSERMTPEVQDRIGQWIYQTQGPGAWEAWGKGGSTGNTGMVRGGAGQTALLGQTGGDTQAAQPERPQGLLGGFFGPEGRDRRARLAIALEGMTLNPNRAFIEGLQQDISERREDRKTTAQQNRTLDYLRSLGTPQAQQALRYAEGTGDITGALRMATDKGPQPKFMEVGGRLVRIDPNTNEVTEVLGKGPDSKGVSELRKEFAARDEVKAFVPIARQYANIISSAASGTGPGDIALVFSYMKMLDPGSTVNQGEQASAQNAGGVPSAVRSMYNQLIGGGSLDTTVRRQFVSEATKIYNNTKAPYDSIADQYSRFAADLGFDPTSVVIPSGYGGTLYQPPLDFQVPPPPAGIDSAQWQQAWENMTDEERRQFIQGQP